MGGRPLALAEIKPEWRQLLTPMLLAEGQDPTWQSTRHHRVIDREFRRLICPGNDDDILIISCPPRHGKSTYLSHWAPAHYLLRHPTNRVMLCSYGMRLAKFLSRRVRDRVHMCAPLFGLKGVNPMVSAADDWELDGDGGGLMASGVEGSIIGRGANLILIDDYIRKGKDAASPTVRDNQWEWFQSTVSTRREPGGKICILATPWHDDDLIGRIMSQREELGLKVRRVAFQAIRVDDGTPDPLGRAEGEALWPSQWPAEALDKQRRLMGPYWWQAQYQGVPGQYGRNEWPETYFANIWAQEDEWPVNAPFSSVALDPSKGAHEDSGDYQAMVYAAFANGKLWLDFDVDRRPVPQMMRDFARFCYDRRPGIVGIESNAFQHLLAPDYLAACQAIHYNVTEPELMENTVNKLVRIMRLATYFDARSIRVRRNAGGEEFIRQAKAFPNGDYDDACFVAGTKISTPFGEVNIEDVRVGDMVDTRFGPRRVRAAGPTGVRPVIEVITENGALVGTGNHPVLSPNGFLPMREVCSMVVCQSKPPNQFVSYSSGSASVATQSRSRGPIETTTPPMRRTAGRASGAYIKRFGRRRTVLSPTGVTSTMPTETRSITRSRISPALPPRSMRLSMRLPGRSEPSAQKASSILTRSGRLRLSGTVRRLGSHGTRIMASRQWPIVRPSCLSATNAMRSSYRKAGEYASVRPGVDSDSMLLSESRVVNRRTLGDELVYNLSVDGNPEYIANGFVVHNCDAAEMAIRLLNYYVTGSWNDGEAEILVA